MLGFKLGAAGAFLLEVGGELRITIEHLLAPTLAVTDAAGIDLRTALHEGTRNAEHHAGHHN